MPRPMPKMRNLIPLLALCLPLLVLLVAIQGSRALAAPVQNAPAGGAKTTGFLGTVQTISGRVLTIKNDTGATMQVTLLDDANLLRIEPGQTNLKGASPFALTDLQTGDRVLARGTPSDDGKQITASSLIAIKHADIVQKQQQERDDWRKRGVGGLVKSVNAADGSITISTAGGKQTVVINTTSSTALRRYAPASVNFDDAKPAPLTDIKPGDQLEARGTKSADGQSLQAQEIVSGTFRNIAGTIVSLDPAASTLTLTDLASKRQVTVQVTPSTQIKKLDPAIAQRIALRLKGGSSDGGASGDQQGPGTPGGPGRPAPDPAQFLARAPSVTLKDFEKGNAVMLVATGGIAPGSVTAVTIIGGVEPMLQASASASQAMLSNSWSLGGGGDAGGDAGP
jgi:Domain of unknown function (DUF5666)